LIVADILLVNAGFAEAHPEWVSGLVKGILQGNAAVRQNPAAAAPFLARAFKWSAEDSINELSKVHLANWPENMEFFSGRIDNAGSFGYIYETALDIYGPEISALAAPMETFLWPGALERAGADGAFEGETAQIALMTSQAGGRALEAQELLSRDLYFYFDPNSSVLTAGREKENSEQLNTIRQWLRVSPGSRVLLRGHADGSKLPEIEAKEGAAMAREARLGLRALSQERCTALRDRLLADGDLDAVRVETRAVGADEPTGKGPAADRRVEARWFTF